MTDYSPLLIRRKKKAKKPKKARPLNPHAVDGRIVILVSPVQRKRLDLICQAERLSLSEVLRIAIVSLLEQYEKNGFKLNVSEETLQACRGKRGRQPVYKGRQRRQQESKE